MGPYPPQEVAGIYERRVGFTHRAGRYRLGGSPFSSRFVRVVMYGRISNPGTRPYPPRVKLASTNAGLGLHTVRGGIDSGDRRFRPRFVRVVDVWKEF